jgi:hypothetical protein
VPAGSPQAKGRSERAWGTLQDRLVSELRRAGATSREEADAVLERFVPRFNARFGVPAAVAQPVWRPWPSPFTVEAELCFHYRRTVSRDSTIPWDGSDLRVPRRGDGRPRAGRVVIVEEHLDGSLWVRDRDERQRLLAASPAPRLLRARNTSRAVILPLEAAEPDRDPTDEPRAPSVASVSAPWRPPRDHPWRAVAGTFYGRGGDDHVGRNSWGTTFHGGPGDDHVRLNEGTFYGGLGYDTVGTNKGTFKPGPQ